MNFNQTTRNSLILSLRDRNDQQAWQEFVELYQPMIEMLATRLGMQKSDVHDATQEVLVHLTRVVDQWEPSRQQGNVTFRGWLYRVARNVMVRILKRRRRQELATGGQHAKEIFEQENPSNSRNPQSSIANFNIRFLFELRRNCKHSFGKIPGRRFGEPLSLRNRLNRSAEIWTCPLARFMQREAEL